MSEVKARIVLWGITGAGKTTTLEMIHSKLQPDLRSEIRREATSIDPTVYYEAMSISLGRVGGVESQIEMVAVPGSEEQVITRKQLLDEVDGIILVLDCSPERMNENEPAIAELRQHLTDYGRRLEDVPLVLQYNKRDVADPFAIEDFHRTSGLGQAAVFETIATTGHGVLATLTTISKHVVRARRAQSSPAVADSTPPDAGSNDLEHITPVADVSPVDDSLSVDDTSRVDDSSSVDDTSRVDDSSSVDDSSRVDDSSPVDATSPVDDSSPVDATSPEEAIPSVDAESSSSDILEAAILAEGELVDVDELEDDVQLEFTSPGLQPDWDATDETGGKPDASIDAELRIVSAGTAQVDSEGGLRLPLVLGDENGETRSVVLTMRLDGLPRNGRD